MCKRAWTVLTAIALILLTGMACEAVAGNVPDEIINMEYKYLFSKSDDIQEKFARDPKNQDPATVDFYTKELRKIKAKLLKLESDPDQYFYELSRSSAAAGAQNTGRCLGNCNNQQSTCLSQCKGDGQCSGYCFSAHSACISNCS